MAEINRSASGFGRPVRMPLPSKTAPKQPKNPSPAKDTGTASSGLLETEIKQVEKIVAKEQMRLRRIPLLIPLLGSFGLVSTFYGFEKVLDTTILVEQPLVMIAIGVGLLILTGAAAQKL